MSTLFPTKPQPGAAFPAEDQLLQAALHRARCLVWEGEVVWPPDSSHPAPCGDTRVLGEEAFLSWLPIAVAHGEDAFLALRNACLPEDHQHAMTNQHRALQENRGYFAHLSRYRLADGSLCWLQEAVQVETLAPGHWRLLGTFTDVTSLKRAQDHLCLSEVALHRQTFRDPLTQLANRSALVEELQHLQALPPTSVTLFALDIDNFKVINDSLGHHQGDTVLRAIAQRLKWLLQSEYTPAELELYRLGGDEFALLLRTKLSAAALAGLAERVLNSVTTPLIVQGQSLTLTASMGVARSESSVSQNLLRHADTAMYQAKRQRRASWLVFDPDMENRAHKRLALEIELRRALENQELTCFYQPILDLATNQVTHLEALARWQHPTKGMISPAEFIPIAEETGLILPLGGQILRQACFQARRWRLNHPHLGISVNVSGIQLRSPWFVETVLSILDESGLPPSALTLEITESVLMADSAHHLLVLQALAENGIQLAIDDFGTGYSSMAYLSQLPVHILKIDRMFVERLVEPITTKDNKAIIRAVVALAQSQEMQVTAEGIETSSQLVQLRLLGCDHGQGYYLAKPLSPRETTAFLDASHSDRAQAA